MNDEYTELKRELEVIELTRLDLATAIRSLMKRLQRSDHPRREKRVAKLRQLLRKLT